ILRVGMRREVAFLAAFAVLLRAAFFGAAFFAAVFRVALAVRLVARLAAFLAVPAFLVTRAMECSPGEWDPILPPGTQAVRRPPITLARSNVGREVGKSDPPASRAS